MKKGSWIMKGILIAVLVPFAIAAFGFGTMYLWNWLVPDLFHGPVINIYQTFGLLLLSKIFFGGMHGKGHAWKARARERWRARMEERWDTMSPEERDKAREAFRNRCGGWGARWHKSYPDNGNEGKQ